MKEVVAGSLMIVFSRKTIIITSIKCRIKTQQDVLRGTNNIFTYVHSALAIRFHPSAITCLSQNETLDSRTAIGKR